MSFVIYLLVIMHGVYVNAAQGSSCHYKNGCSPQPDVCSVSPPVCVTDWSGQYCQMHNIARGKPASQSSTWPDTTVTYDASKAVDGDVSTHFDLRSCSHTNEPNSGNASWHVPLGGTFLISRITIYLRDDNIDHNEAVEILVSGNTCRKLPVADIRNSTSHLITNPVTLSCTEPTEGDNVTIVMAGPYLALCEVQVFGKEKESCHCSNGCLNFPNTSCSKPPSGPVCKSPWYGSFCQMENIAFQKNATQSSTYPSGGPYCAAYAVDGNTDSRWDHKSCSHTNEAVGGTASWQVLLDDHQVFNISRIRIYLRNDIWEHNKDMQVLVDGSPCDAVNGTTLDNTLGSVTNPFNVTCTHVIRGNNVTITMSGQFLTLCEVQVFVCSDGWFGSDCDKQCQCQDTTEVCDKETGNCRSGCTAGKQGPGCQKSCERERYGVNCSQLCGSCKDGISCNKTNGSCALGCMDNFERPYCKKCVQERYGNNCRSLCGHCKDGHACNQNTGHCEDGCIPGYEKPRCTDECLNKTYGPDCSLACGRCLNGTCNSTDGACIHGCEPGFVGDRCVPATGNKQESQSVTGAAVGAVIGVLSVAALVAVLVYIRRRRSLQKPNKEQQLEEDTIKSSFSAASSERTASTSMQSTKLVQPPKKPKPPGDNVYENSDPYYNVVPAPVPLERLMQYVRERLASDGFEHEYKLLHHGLNAEHTEGKKPENKKRNRFLALFPYDASRVVLSPDGDATCDYIHASYLQGFHESSKFIAAQGPNNVTVDDFWRMIWQENVSQIVMLTRVMELNRKKCELYWPDGMKDKKCGNILIKPLLSTVRADFTTRKFLVQHSNKPSVKRTVTQLHFTSWPDHDVPSAPALVGFWKQCRSLTSSEEDITGPVVVHCSAGVGRTGTFIALDNLFDEAESLNKVNVFSCVSKMREARMNMVQTVEQYRFVHESVMEAIESRGTLYTLSDFEKMFGTELKYTRRQEMEMNKQFQSLESMKMEIPEKLASDAYLPDNISKNRNKDIVPVNRGRPFLSTPVADHNNYINAVILPSSTQPLGLIATQTPLAQTVVDFWRLVYDHDCFTIVCLQDMEDNQALYPRQNETLNIGPFRITTLQVDASRDSFTEMQLNLALREQDNTHQQIRVFNLRSQIPGPPEPILDFVNEVGTQGCSEEHKTLVHCPDGARLCGVFCSALNIITRLRLDKEADIYLTIRELQCIRPQFIESYNQYKLCYDLVKAYLRDTSTYANM
ncbi:receptor-type tyrosine-protein phosphatase T-like [Haliotis rufescens]|uniref:receptor-type tyrosine-protein phosphatase T-like n=1 Tax=Haliotis rufescens TaxID=6454 RepID=UPI00201EE369|nr:receptor-type tyrosine-protein phosphatase T-like [Haliotis rufescens]